MDLFARCVDADMPEQLADYVEDPAAFMDAYVKEISGGAANPTVALDAQMRSLYLKLARYELLIEIRKQIKAVGDWPEVDEALKKYEALLRAEGINPDAFAGMKANVEMQIAMKQQALDKLSEGKEPPKHKDFLKTLRQISYHRKMNFDPYTTTVRTYCNLVTDLQEENAAYTDK